MMSEAGVPSRAGQCETTLPRVRWFAALGALFVGLVVNLWCQIGLFLTQPGWGLGMFRWYYSYDQLSYLAIVQNVSHRNWAPVEPFTETGTNHYPRAYYQLLGLVSDLTGVSPVMTWNVVAATFQAALVVVIAIATVLLTRRWWTAVLAPLPLLAGTFSWFLSSDWKQTLDSHAVLWGPFGVLYTANGESASLCVAISGLLVVLLIATGRVPRRARLAWGVVACTAIGLLAAVQTYSFLSATYVLLYSAAIYGLVVTRRRWASWGAGVALVVALFVSPVIAETVSPLAALALGAVPAIPGLWVLCVRLSWRPLWALGGLVIAAVPQTLGTVLAVAQGNEFLVYREASSKDLGIPLLDGLRAAALPIVLLLVVLVLGARWRRPVATAASSGTLLSWALLATNDKWGANQEPYRFWIDMFTIACVLGMVLLAWLVARPVEASTTLLGDDIKAAPAPSPRGVLAGRIAAGVVAVLFVASLTDYAAFRREVSGWQPLDFATPNALALAKAADASEGGIVLPDPCIDPFTLKTAWGGPTAFYNLGLAWPENRDALQGVLNQRAESVVNIEDVATAGVSWVLTDSTCQAGWGALLADQGLMPTITVPAEGTSYKLWRVSGVLE